MIKVSRIGIIAEDESDFEVSRILIKRIINKQSIGFKKAIGNGCGKVRRKALDYSIDLQKRGCNLLILIHDLDRNNYSTLRNDLEDKLNDSPIKNKFVCIPKEEIEAWFLSDPNGIKIALNLRKQPNVIGKPEDIKSPKEKLGSLISICSNKEKLYLNTKHNQLIAAHIDLKIVNKKCSAFSKLESFLLTYKYA